MRRLQSIVLLGIAAAGAAHVSGQTVFPTGVTLYKPAQAFNS
jgi:hypothetical protein